MAVTCSDAAHEWIAAMSAALQAGDVAGADAAVARLQPELTPPVLRAVVAQYMRHQHWSEALDLLRTHGRDDDPSLTMQTRLAANMVALRRHRPAIYDAIHRVPARSQCQIVRVGQGVSVSQALPGKPDTILCGRQGPAGQVQQAAAALADHQRQCLALGLAGIGDGHLLHWIASNPPASALGLRQCVYIVETFPELVAHALMLHDWSAPTGPIADERFQWYVGPDAVERLGRDWSSNRWLPRPRRIATQGIEGQAISQAVEQLLHDTVVADEQRRRRVHEHYAALPNEHWIDRLGPNPSARPRALIVTSRFTTVLQYSARDLADALEQLGYDVLYLIEPAAHLRLDMPALVDTIDRFRPDVMFALDHLRYELGDLLPPDLCHVCWIQDDLPNLTTRDAGRSLGHRDYVLTWEKARYAELFDYPADRCVYMSKLTRVPQRPTHWRCDGDDLVYVSNASGRIDDLEAAVLKGFQSDPHTLRLAQECCRRLRAIYEQGGSQCSLPQLRRLVQRTADDLRLRPDSAQGLEWIVHKLEHPLNNALYRQQALGWVIDLAGQRGLRVGLFGSGWEKNPTFAPYARGPVAYGPELEQLTRSARINLQIVPFNCLHQRLMDGLVAGGFFLVRHHPLDLLAPRLFALVDQLDPSIISVEHARRTLPPEQLEPMLELIGQLADHDDRHSYDAIAAVREAIREGLGDQFRPMPRLEDVSFDSAASLGAAIDRFLADEPARRAIAHEQRAFIEAHFTYLAGMRRAMQAIHRHLAGARA